MGPSRTRALLAFAFVVAIVAASSGIGAAIAGPGPRAAPGPTAWTPPWGPLQDESDEAKLALDGVKKAILDGLEKLEEQLRGHKDVPEDLLKKLGDLKDGLRNVKSWSDLFKWLEGWASFFKTYSNLLETFLKKLLKFLPIVSLFIDVPEIIERIKNASTQLDGFLDYLILILEIVRGLGIVIGDIVPIPFILDLLQFLADYIGEKLADLIFGIDWSKVWDFLKSLGMSLLDFLGWLWEVFKALGTDIWSFLKWAWGLLSRLGMGIWEFIDWAWEQVKGLGLGFFEFLRRVWNDVVSIATTQMHVTGTAFASATVFGGDAAVLYLTAQNVGGAPAAVSAGSLQIVSAGSEVLAFSMADRDGDGFLDPGASATWAVAVLTAPGTPRGPVPTSLVLRYNAEPFLEASVDVHVQDCLRGGPLAAYRAYQDAVRWIRTAFRNGDEVFGALEILAGGTMADYRAAKAEVVHTSPGPGAYPDLKGTRPNGC